MREEITGLSETGGPYRLAMAESKGKYGLG